MLVCANPNRRTVGEAEHGRQSPRKVTANAEPSIHMTGLTTSLNKMADGFEKTSSKKITKSKTWRV